MNGLDEVARAFVELFDRLNVPYAIMGGLAVRVHALPRPTFDVDFTAIIDRAALPAFYQTVESLGLVVPAAQRSGWIDQVHGMPVVKFQWFTGEYAIDIDVFLGESEFQKQVISRRQRHAVDGWQAWFISPEDLLLLKLLADRPKDRADVADILFVQAQLDVSYMKEWAIKLGVSQQLESALSQERE